MNKKILFYIFCVLMIASCSKQTDYSLSGELPSPPEFSIDPVEGDPNSFVVTDLSEGNFSRSWSFEGGQPGASTLESDTVFYSKQGDYSVVLNVSSSSGGGTAFKEKTIVVESDVAGCQLDFLNEDCSTKCWRLSPDPASVKVGPIPYSGEWYTSPDITTTQEDDRWCFNEDGTFTYDNSGATFSSCAGFVDIEDYNVPDLLTWTLEEGEGVDDLNRMTLEGIFMGVEDSGPTYDIVEVSEDEMILLAPLKPCDGSPSTGWFTMTFYKAE